MLRISLIILFLALSAQGFGGKGHQVVANVAWQLLTSTMQSKVQDILRKSELFYKKDIDRCSDCTPLGKVANWADAVRDKIPDSVPQHFVNVVSSIDCPVLVPSGDFSSTECQLVLSRDCPDSDCVIWAVSDFSGQLGSSRRHLVYNFLRGILGNRQRESLMWITHFVADIHQPLHCSRASDRGGNDITVSFLNYSNEKVPVLDIFGLFCDIPWLGDFLCTRPALDLHDVWDDSLIDQIIAEAGSQQALEAELLAVPVDAGCGNGSDISCALAWANESLEAALKYAYRNVDGSEIVSGAMLGDSYFNIVKGVMRERLALAAKRLASTLEAVLS